MPSKPTTIESHSTDAECTVIGALLIDPEAVFKIDDVLTSEDFYDPIYRDLYSGIIELAQQGTAVDFVTVAEKLRDNVKLQQLGGSAFLAKLASNVPTSSHIAEYADIVIDKSRRRSLRRIGCTIGDLAEDETHSADDLVEMAERKFLSLARRTSHADPIPIGAMRTERFDHYAALFERDDAPCYEGVQTGLAGIDEKLTTLAPGQLIVLAGRPGMGKTALALDIAANVAFDQQKVVAFFSLEMTKAEVFGRLLGKRLGVESWKLEKGTIDEHHFHAMGAVLDEFGNCPFYIDDDPNTTLLNIRSKARRHQMQHGLDLLVIDYLQLIEVTDRIVGENQTQRITFISKSLKRLARELCCPVLALSQLSRACDHRPDKRPQLSDLRDSGSIEQDGDRILMLYRESEYHDDCDDPAATDLFIRKNRHGPKGTVALRFDRERMAFASNRLK